MGNHHRKAFREEQACARLVTGSAAVWTCFVRHFLTPWAKPVAGWTKSIRNASIIFPSDIGISRKLIVRQTAYNPIVARGWESKSVELQQDDHRSAGTPKLSLTPEQRETVSRKEGLKLSRNRILEQLHAAENPRYRTILEQALAELEEQIRRLD